MVWQEALGLAGGAMTTLSLLPQIVRLFRLRSAKEISLSFSLLFMIGILTWMFYGITLGLPSVILWNAISLAFSSAMLYAKLKYG